MRFKMGSHQRTGILERGSSTATRRNLIIKKEYCPKCNHHKTITNTRLTKCTKCGFEIKKY